MVEELRDRLRRLLRAAAPTSSSAQERRELPDWFRTRMAAREGRMAARAPHDATTSGPPSELVERSNARGRCSERVRRFPLDLCHGDGQLSAVRDGDSHAIAALLAEEEFASFEADRATFLDIETTGLCGGAGTHVFLVALAELAGDELILWQGFARGPEEEPALLDHVARELALRPFLVSFFGRSFDRHRLEDKMRIHGIAPPFGPLAHLDLYWPLRKLHRGEFADTRLATLERALAGVERQADLPGSQAPRAWFDFLAGRAHRLEQVFQHNQLDVLSLVSLCAYLRGLPARAEHGAVTLGAAQGLAAAYLARREPVQAQRWIEVARLRSGSEPTPRLAELGARTARLRRRLERRAALEPDARSE